jgi:sulfur carrier protein ThiS
MTIRLLVKLAGGLVQTLGYSEREFRLPPGSTVAALLAEIGIPEARPVIVGRNGWAIEPTDELHDGDRILISPVFSGG